jgi:hypothetical protein
VPEPEGGETEPEGGRERLFVTLPWLCLGVALSPALLELARHLVAAPWARYTGVVAALFGVTAAVAPLEASPQRRAGLLLLGTGIAIQLLAAAAGPPGLGRLALPLGITGLACWLGRPASGVAALSVFLVPIPYTFVAALSPALEATLLEAAAALASPLAGGGLVTDGRVLTGGFGEFWVRPPHGGVPLAALLAAGLALRAVRRGNGLLAAGMAAVLGAGAALPLQIVALAGAVLLAASGRPAAAWTWLDQGVMMLAGAALVGEAVLAPRRRAP